MHVGEEEKKRAHEALEKQEAELARYAQQVAADQQQAAALQAKIKAMEEKVISQLSSVRISYDLGRLNAMVIELA